MAINEEEKALEQLAVEFGKEMEKRKENAAKRLSEEQNKFVSAFERSWNITENSHYLLKEMMQGLRNGRYAKPSEFYLSECGWLFGTIITEKDKAAFLYASDAVNRWQCSRSYYRRSFRSADYSCYLTRLSHVFGNFAKLAWLDEDICDILSGKLSENAAAFINKNSSNLNTPLDAYIYLRNGLCYNSEIIAYELDKGNSRLEEILTDIIMGEGSGTVNQTIIRGIMYSRNGKMHELLGKLLLAARLQEGLRQAICENADVGTVEAFKVILKVIADNDMIRFSSVKRAIGTWTGLLLADSPAADRITAKTLKLMVECIDDEAAREKYLFSEDSMEIYISLWTYGLYEMKTAAEKVKMLSESGTHHQLLTAGYFAANIEDVNNGNEMAKHVIFAHNEPDILAVFMPYFMNGWRGGYTVMWDSDGGRQMDLKNGLLYLSYWYKDEAEAEKMYERLWEIYNIIPKKSLTFSPCIFPWYGVELTKSMIAERLCLTAFMLEDNDKLDACCKLIKEIDSGSRWPVLRSILSAPQTAAQRAALTDALADKETYTREQAFKMVKSTRLDKENYLQMEDMLKYKAADMRANLITLLLDRSDDSIYGTISRLLGDKKEEKRTAALDMIMQLSKDSTRKALFEKCRPLAKQLAEPSTKEKILIENICGSEKTEEKLPLFDPFEDRYDPAVPDNDFTRECVKTFMTYFPDSSIGSLLYPDTYKKSVIKSIKGTLGAVCASVKRANENLAKLSKLVFEHRTEEFCRIGSGEIVTIDSGIIHFSVRDENGNSTIPFMDIWRKWMKENDIVSDELVRMSAANAAVRKSGDATDCFADSSEPYITMLFGNGFEKSYRHDYSHHIGRILDALIKENASADELNKLCAAAELWFIKCVPEKDVMLTEKLRSGYTNNVHLIGHHQILSVLGNSFDRNTENGAEKLALDYLTAKKCFNDPRYDKRYVRLSIYGAHGADFGSYSRCDFVPLSVNEFIFAAYKGIIYEKELYSVLFKKENLSDALEVLSGAAIFIREADRAVSVRERWYVRVGYFRIAKLVGDRIKDHFNEEDRKLIKYAEEVYETVINEVLSVELKRGDSPTEYSGSIKSVTRIYGLDKFIAILSAMGKDTLARSTYYVKDSKKDALSHLLSVCIPEKDDNAEKLREKLKGTDITEKRLIEAAMYSPEWLPIIGEYLGWEGFTSACYYFIAHMNERFDDKRKAVIAKYTPLTEEELNDGAFDISWFRSAYETLGQKHFDMIYDAAKYISDGAKHSRARKYADAVLGKMNAEETVKTVADKRNKDLLMAYALIPIKDEDDICSRYLYLQQFLKESKKFGSQRSASEKKAVEIAMQNLSINAGYADVTRLTLRMETKLINDSRELFEEKEIDGTIFKLSVDDLGKAEIICTKGGKALKSIPAKLKKNEYIVRLTDTKKKLTEQYRRTKTMFEQAMEDSTEFTVGELKTLKNNPVVKPILKNLVFVCGEKLGFLDKNELTDYAGNVTVLSDNDKVVVAHPYALYKDGNWQNYQKNLFENHLVQPFKQVFRELYVKTAEETEMTHSLRYSGNQIQPAKTVACLKSRRWVADVEDGLQKVYYKENIVARIYAMADWFSPADIEAPTLEWVEFTDRKTGKPLVIKDIPDIIFSEVMRDVDLAVSVAHAGGVDPETSHSTVEMRAALIEFTLPLFKLTNVALKGSHAHISGKYGEYTLHLGSGVIHKQGGAMINILPVHSQHRGKLFLPFADEDPKTAEIITKVLFLAEDSKIKDPSILEQIK